MGDSFAGSALVVAWVQAAATTTITGDHKSFTYTPSINLIKKSAGADPQETYIAGVKDGTWTFNANMQSGTDSGGTITMNTLAEGNIGTLYAYPEGIVAGKTKVTYPTMSQGVAQSHPYADLVEITVNGQQNGARVEGTSTGTAGA